MCIDFFFFPMHHLYSIKKYIYINFHKYVELALCNTPVFIQASVRHLLLISLAHECWYCNICALGSVLLLTSGSGWPDHIKRASEMESRSHLTSSRVLSAQVFWIISTTLPFNVGNTNTHLLLNLYSHTNLLSYIYIFYINKGNLYVCLWLNNKWSTLHGISLNATSW